MKPTIKFCGIRSVEDVEALSDLPIDYAGFIMAPSKRQVTINILCKLVMLLPKHISPVTVLVNPTEDEVRNIVDDAGVSTIQLHGDENVELCVRLRERYGVTIIKALAARGTQTVNDIQTYGTVADVILIDTYQKDLRGGTGKTFKWEDIPKYHEACHEFNRPLWIAGGLTPHNVNELIKRYALDGVDVSSGIELYGKKDITLMKQFIERVTLC